MVLFSKNQNKIYKWNILLSVNIFESLNSCCLERGNGWPRNDPQNVLNKYAHGEYL